MTLEGRIEDLEDIIKILINLLKINKFTPDFIKLELRHYHYCYDCMNHFRSCKCEEDTNNNINNMDNIIDDNYTSSEYDDDDDDDKN
jgi:hypothetical protein